MRAIVIHDARDLRVEEMDAAAPGPGQVAVAVETGGICGSDLHYYNHGGFGTVRLREPMILGHEVAGTIVALGSEVEGLSQGDRVAISPSRPCRACVHCLDGRPNQCLNMRFYGSAMPFPHIQGAFRTTLVADATQCHRAGPDVTPGLAALAEPFSVCLHAVRQAGDIAGRRVLVTGCGPIGALCIIAARHAGAGEIIATDLSDPALSFATSVGADTTVNVATNGEDLAPYRRDKGLVDVAFEASGSPAALSAAIDVMRPGGRIVQLGLGGDTPVPLNQLVAKEIELRGSFRFHEEFAWAMDLINRSAVDLAPLISATLPMDDAVAAFELAGDRTRSMKVQIAFT